jgi:hypothetical protein
MPRCPHCGHEWKERGVRIKDAADLSKQIDEAIAAFGDEAAQVQMYLGRARSARQGGMAAGKTLAVLSDLLALFNEDPGTFAYALRQTLASDSFDWKRPNLTGYLTAIYKSARAKDSVMKVEDLAAEVALVMIGVWHRWAALERMKPESFGDLAHGETIRRVAWALKKEGRLPADSPTHALLTADVRRVLAAAEARRRGLAFQKPDRQRRPACTRDQGAVNVNSELAPELAALADKVAKRTAANDATEQQVWGE